MEYKAINDEIANRIKDVIRQHNIPTITDFARLIDVEEKTLHNHLNGVTSLSLKTVVSILQRYPDIDANWLLRGTATPDKPQGRYIDNDLYDMIIGTINVYNKKFLSQDTTPQE